MVDFPAPAHPATMNNVSKSFFCERFVCSMVNELLLMVWSVAMAFDWLSVNQINHPFKHILPDFNPIYGYFL
jgi:hypothetical protein